MGRVGREEIGDVLRGFKRHNYIVIIANTI